MYTAHGQQQRKNLLSLIDEDKVLNALRPVIEKVPQIVVSRVKSEGSGGSKNKRFSAYSESWKKTRSKRSLQTSKKDFWFDGIMWDSYQIVKESIGGGAVSFELGTTDGKSRNGSLYLSDIHSDNEGAFILDLTDEEWEKVEDEMFEAVLKTMVI